MLKLKRRRMGLTHYGRRKRLIISEKPRLVIRSSNRYIYVQLIESQLGGDRLICSANSKELRRLGWDFGLGNVPASYLTGAILAQRAFRMGISEAVLDIGLATPTRGCKAFAVAKACLDFGLKIKCDEAVMPSEDRIRGEHIVRFASSLKDGVVFLSIRSRNLKPDLLRQQFDSVLSKIKAGPVH